MAEEEVLAGTFESVELFGVERQAFIAHSNTVINPQTLFKSSIVNLIFGEKHALLIIFSPIGKPTNIYLSIPTLNPLNLVILLKPALEDDPILSKIDHNPTPLLQSRLHTPKIHTILVSLEGQPLLRHQD